MIKKTRLQLNRSLVYRIIGTGKQSRNQREEEGVDMEEEEGEDVWEKMDIINAASRKEST